MNDAVCETVLLTVYILFSFLRLVLCLFAKSNVGEEEIMMMKNGQTSELGACAAQRQPVYDLTNKIKCVTLNQRKTAEPKTNHNRTHAQRTASR